MTDTASVALPRILRVGGGCSMELAEVLESAGLARPLIITDPFLAAQPFLARITARLAEAGIEAEVFSEVRPDPTTDSIDLGVRALRRGEFDCVVGIGGGSPMDTAKAVALLGSRGGAMRDYKAPAVTDAPTLPVIAIPTTAGSGSECTRFTIITDSATNEKMLCAGLAFLPAIALIDYTLTMRMPPRLTADTGVDALVHAVEAYVSRKANPFTDALALTAMRTLFANLRVSYAEPANEQARAQMMIAATQAGMAFSNSSVALVHGMSRPIGAHFHVAHGLSNAMLMPTITAYSVDAAPDRYATCARTVGVASADMTDSQAARRLVTALHDLNADLEVPGPRRYGIPEDSWRESIPVMAKQAKASGSPDNNPRVASIAEIEDLYRSLWK
ncbi:iron-containing alcohol dehydrogenase [Amycolatopsis panacis]|uniref:Iron-containing alcohol dehydrogenase n=1 Tax=Amycolatopsis panacis TaxID=2340917 RepID=A0A419HJH1_9PSEU|nr:iron-containing alcohol dehydrogenase [Amycolatopsis panacis]RJQ75924.1 iron-containing alcohol dehydrogenase [Amycolatopsis panacis]